MCYTFPEPSCKLCPQLFFWGILVKSINIFPEELLSIRPDTGWKPNSKEDILKYARKMKTSIQ